MSFILQELLTLPTTSKGFTNLPQSITDSDADSFSPPHKTPRRDADSDSPTAARAQNNPNQPIKIQLIGDLPNPKTSPRSDTLQQCIRSLLTREQKLVAALLPATYEALYNDCLGAVCVSNTGESLYQKLKLELEKTVDRLSKELSSEPKDDKAGWIRKFSGACQWFEEQIALLQSLLTYLDQVYIRRAHVLTIRQLSFSLFVRAIFENPNLMETLRDSVLSLVTSERTQPLVKSVHTNVIQDLISHLFTHQQYSSFEEFYLDATRKYYTAESDRLANEMKDDPTKFFRHVQSRIKEEVERSRKLLPAGSWSVIRETTLKALLSERMHWIAKGALGNFLEEEDYPSLATMHELFSEAAGPKVICAEFKSYVQTRVNSIVKDSGSDDKMVDRLLDFQAVANSAISKCFLDEPVQVSVDQIGATPKAGSTSTVPEKRRSQEFVYALADAFTVGFRARRNKPAEMIARHLDKLMRKGQGAMTDADFSNLLDSALGLYRFTDDKDVFRGFYLRAFTKRLLLEKSASRDFEETMLRKLRDEYDPQFEKGEQVVTDLDLSQEMMAEHHSKRHSAAKQNLTVMVLKQNAWPYSTEVKIKDKSIKDGEGGEIIKSTMIMPPEMQEELDAFEIYYKTRFSGRKLLWQPSVGTATLIAHFKTGSKELSVSLYQAIVLLLFNGAHELAFIDILEQTKIDDATLRLTLQSLALGRKKVLIRAALKNAKNLNPDPNINDEDKFRFNDAFNDPRPRIHINSIQAKVTDEESRRTQTSIDGDRAHYLDAAIVRIMKAKKELAHEKLMLAAVDAVKGHFTPDVKSIKERIGRLMEQEYLRRDDDNPQMLYYIA